MKNSKWLLAIVCTFFISAVLIGCQSNDNDENETKEAEGNKEAEENKEAYEGESPVVTMTMEDGGEVLMELYPDIAPNTVNNFISLVEDGFYDGVIFHRVIPSFMIQGGDPEGQGTGGPGYSIKGEFGSNGFENNLDHERGVLSMARTGDPDSAGSQFFIMVADSPQLDGEYAGFGKVIEGIEVADDIVEVDRDGSDKPDEDQVIHSMTVELNGYEPAEVEQE